MGSTISSPSKKTKQLSSIRGTPKGGEAAGLTTIQWPGRPTKQNAQSVQHRSPCRRGEQIEVKDARGEMGSVAPTLSKRLKPSLDSAMWSSVTYPTVAACSDGDRSPRSPAAACSRGAADTSPPRIQGEQVDPPSAFAPCGAGAPPLSSVSVVPHERSDESSGPVGSGKKMKRSCLWYLVPHLLRI